MSRSNLRRILLSRSVSGIVTCGTKCPLLLDVQRESHFQSVKVVSRFLNTGSHSWISGVWLVSKRHCARDWNRPQVYAETWKDAIFWYRKSLVVVVEPLVPGCPHGNTSIKSPFCFRSHSHTPSVPQQKESQAVDVHKQMRTALPGTGTVRNCSRHCEEARFDKCVRTFAFRLSSPSTYYADYRFVTHSLFRYVPTTSIENIKLNCPAVLHGGKEIMKYRHWTFHYANIEKDLFDSEDVYVSFRQLEASPWHCSDPSLRCTTGVPLYVSTLYLRRHRCQRRRPTIHYPTVF